MTDRVLIGDVMTKSAEFCGYSVCADRETDASVECCLAAGHAGDHDFSERLASPRVSAPAQDAGNSSAEVELARQAALRALLVDVAQIFDGWHQDGTAWTEHDESVRKRVSEALKSI